MPANFTRGREPVKGPYLFPFTVDNLWITCRNSHRAAVEFFANTQPPPWGSGEAAAGGLSGGHIYDYCKPGGSGWCRWCENNSG